MILTFKQIFKTIEGICILIFWYELLDIIWIKTTKFYLYDNIYVMILCFNNICFFKLISKVIYKNKLNSIWDILEDHTINASFCIQTVLCAIYLFSWSLIDIIISTDRYKSYKNIFDMIVMCTINTIALSLLTLIICCVSHCFDFNIQIHTEEQIQDNQEVSIITIDQINEPLPIYEPACPIYSK